MDTVEPGAEESGAESKPKPLFWRESTFLWNQAATTTMLGVGRDNIGHEHEVYAWMFRLKPNIYLLDLPDDKVSISTEIGWTTELTNGNTTYKNETFFLDLPLTARYARKLWANGGSQKGEYETKASLNGGFLFPTSKVSYSQGKYLSIALGAGASQKIKLLGSKADGLNNVTATFSLSYGHLFSRSYTPTTGGSLRPTNYFDTAKPNPTGGDLFTDQLSGFSFPVDQLGGKLALALPLYKALALSTALGFTANFKHDFEQGAGSDCDLAVLNDPCVVAKSPEDPTTYHPTTAFAVGLEYSILGVVGLGVGYYNEGLQVGPDGQRRDMFYNPEAQFYFDVTANLDAIYSKATGRDKKAGTKAARGAGGMSF